jgi:hypothetical protein
VRLGEMGHRGHVADVDRLGGGAVHGVRGQQPPWELQLAHEEGEREDEHDEAEPDGSQVHPASAMGSCPAG